MNHYQQIAQQLSLSVQQVQNTLELLAEGATIPFIARYRKERTQGLDEVQIASIAKQQERIKELDKRKKAVVKSIQQQGKWTAELEQKIAEIQDVSLLEDLYLPFKQKRATRASKARVRGLEPLAKIIMAQNHPDLERSAKKFLSREVVTIEDALQGARDIVAEWINEHGYTRKKLRRHFERNSIVTAKVIKGKEEAGEKYKDYFAFSQPLYQCKSYRMLALLRAEREGIIRLKVQPEQASGLQLLEDQFLKNGKSEQVLLALKDAYKRLLCPALENEVRRQAKAKADEEAIRVFAKNLQQLLLAAPVGQKRILAIDPGFRTGCKVVCLSAQGDLLHNETIYPHPPQKQQSQAMKKLSTLVEQYRIEGIAIGNGTAGRETERLIQRIRFDRKLQVFVVSEDGASVYSASQVAREEFPTYDVTVRGAVSIGRRLIDPLAELVKVDPKSIGVGQYQHDVDQKELRDSLDRVVESCVNKVGVEVNTASKYLLKYVSGIGEVLAENIVSYRKEHGAFATRKDLVNVPRMGNKVFEQAAGFLRVGEGRNPLDNTAVHPERYDLVQQIAKDQKIGVEELVRNEEVLANIDWQQYVTSEIGLPTLNDIQEELRKPGRDPRQKAKLFEFSKHVQKIEDLQLGMRLPAIVTNITNFGAFADVGIKQDGLIHISNMADRFISDPNEIVHLHQHVEVEVLEVDVARKRIGFRLLASEK